jgi:hypothetical protein
MKVTSSYSSEVPKSGTVRNHLILNEELARMLKLVRSFVVLIAVTIIVALPVFGQEVSKPLTLGRDAAVGTQKLSRGSYTIRFIDDKDGQISFLKGSREVARANYRLVKLTRPAADTSVSFDAATDGSFKMSRIELKGQSFAIEIQ